jgi:hypothetical protein
MKRVEKEECFKNDIERANLAVNLMFLCCS